MKFIIVLYDVNKSKLTNKYPEKLTTHHFILKFISVFNGHNNCSISSTICFFVIHKIYIEVIFLKREKINRKRGNGLTHFLNFFNAKFVWATVSIVILGRQIVCVLKMATFQLKILKTISLIFLDCPKYTVRRTF